VIRPTVAELWQFSGFSKWRLSAIEYLVLFITVQNMVGIDGVISIMQVLIFNEFGLKMLIDA